MHSSKYKKFINEKFHIRLNLFHLASTVIVDLEDLCNLVTPVYACHWRVIGARLNIPNNALENIDHDFHSRAEECCNAMWEKWLNINHHVYWDKVIKAVADLSIGLSGTFLSRGIYNMMSDIIPKVTDQLQKQFKIERYKVSEDDWPSYQPKHFTNVALIHHREKHATETEVEAVANKMWEGKIVVHPQDYENDVSSNAYFSTCKATKDIADIFSVQIPGDDAEYIKPNIFLIEGAPGIGKTILSKEIAFQWANKKILQEKMLLFLISLRDPYIQHVKSFEQFVCYVMKSYQQLKQLWSI